MGVLDDAIREHLELKRRHGASDEEISKEEAEALGPARRDFPAAAPQEEAQVAEGQIAEREPEPPGESVAEPALEPDPVAEEPTVVDEPPPLVDEPEPVEPEPEPETRDSIPETDSTPETEEKSDDDVLEETPEFLQDAPEHDRLWFEQKPPRDFDFE